MDKVHIINSQGAAVFHENLSVILNNIIWSAYFTPSMAKDNMKNKSMPIDNLAMHKIVHIFNSFAYIYLKHNMFKDMVDSSTRIMLHGFKWQAQQRLYCASL